jgi:hypothetical protein
MNKLLAVVATLLTVGGTCPAQTPGPGPQPPAATADSPTADAGLRDLDAMTFSCSKAALNAAAREAAKAPAQGTYQFAYFKIIAGSHHASYEVHFTSNYTGEPELKYCVMLYCQQGWDPGAAKISVAPMTAPTRPGSKALHGEGCTQHVTKAMSVPPTRVPK